MGADHIPGRLEEARPSSDVSLAKGPAAHGPYWHLSWVTSRLTWLQCHAGQGMAGPYGALWPCLFRDSGVVGCTAATPHPIAVTWVQS